MREIQLCLDVPISGEHKEKFQEIRNRTLGRYAQTERASLVVYEQDRDNSWLRGGEVTFVRGAVNDVVTGTIFAIDGILPDGVNVSMGVTKEEADRIRDLEGFNISTEYDPRDYIK